MRINSIIKNKYTQNFSSIIKHQEGPVNYTFNINDTDNSLSIEKKVNGQICPVNEKFRTFCTSVHKLGLMQEFSKIYSAYRRIDLPQKVVNLNIPVSFEELNEYIQLTNVAEKTTLTDHLSNNDIIKAIRNRQMGRLTTGEINPIDKKIIDKLRKHIFDFKISTNTGNISGAHSYEMYERLYDIAHKTPDKEIEVTNALPNNERIRAFAKAVSNVPNLLMLGVLSTDELYNVKPVHFEGMDFNKFRLIKTQDENGKPHYTIYAINYIKKKSNLEHMLNSLFPYLARYGKNHHFQDDTHITGIRMSKDKKVKCKVLSREIVDANTLRSVILIADAKTTYVTKRHFNKKGFYYITEAKLEDTMQYIKATSPEWYKKYITASANQEVQKEKEQELFDLMFSAFQKRSKELGITSEKRPIALEIEDSTEKDNDDFKLVLDRAVYTIERETTQNGTNIYKYSYGETTTNPVYGKTKTVVSEKLIGKVLNHIENNKFKASYKISNDGKIIAYFKYDGVYFKLILTKTSTPTCFPMTENDLKKDIGTIPPDIPKYTSK